MGHRRCARRADLGCEVEALIHYWPITAFVLLLVIGREGLILKTLMDLRTDMAAVKAELGILKAGHERNRIQRRASLRRALVDGMPLPDHGEL
jgi:hypothetical protein